MWRVRARTIESEADVSDLGGGCFIDPKKLVGEQPDLHFEALDNDSVVRARCSAWTKATPDYEGHRAGLIGHYVAEDAGAARAVLVDACRVLRERGCAYAIGPMNGNTWRGYRLVTWGVADPPFFLEPRNPPEWPTHFTEAGFGVIATYSSAVNTDLTVADARTDEHLARMGSQGLILRPIDASRFEHELTRVHQLCLESFADNFLYTPIGREDFVRMYAGVRGHIRPEFVTLAEVGSELVGFLFAMPDLEQAARGESLDTVIAKTIAVKPGRSGAGLGSVLLDLLQRKARAAGFRRVIYALMHDANKSTKIAARYCTPMRRYALYGKALSS